MQGPILISGQSSPSLIPLPAGLSAPDGEVGGEPVKTTQTVDCPGRATKTDSSGLTITVLDWRHAMLAKMRAQNRGNQGRAEKKTTPNGAVMRVIVTWRSNETKTQDYAPPRPTVDDDKTQILRLHGGLAPRCGNRVLAHGQARSGSCTTKTGCWALWPGDEGNLFKWVIAQRCWCEDSLKLEAMEDRGKMVVYTRRGSLLRAW